MAVFVGDSKETDAVRAALKINWSVTNIVNTSFKSVYADKVEYVLKHVVGIDASPLFVARSGIRGANDLVWIGRAANYAAKLTALPDGYPTYITSSVYNALERPGKYAMDNANMWKAFNWNTFNNSTIYGSTYWWALT